MFRVVVAVGVSRVLFLDVRGVGQHQRAQIPRAGCAEDAALESLGNQAREVSAVVEVRMGQDDGVDGSGGDGQGLPVAKPQFLQSLEEPAVHEDAVIARVDEVFGPCDRSGGPQESQGRHELTI